MATVSPGEPTTPSGDDDPVTDVPDTDEPKPAAPPDNPSGSQDGDATGGFHPVEPADQDDESAAGRQGDDPASGGS